MPPIVPQPGLVQIVPYYTTNTDINHQIANVLWFKSQQSTTPSLSNLQGIAAVFDGNWAAVFGGIGSTAKQYLGSVVTDFSSSFGLKWDTRGNFTPTGGGHGGDNPAQVAGLISLNNGERYRGGHFRIYLPWVGETVINPTDANKLTTTAVADITTRFNTMITNMSGSNILGGQLMMLYRHRTDPAKAQLFGIHTFSVQPLLATQRRRLRKVPRHHRA